MAPVVLALQADPRFQGEVCVTGQHREMLDQVTRLFGIMPDHDLEGTSIFAFQGRFGGLKPSVSGLAWGFGV